MTKEEANAEVAALIRTAEDNIKKAQELADEHGLAFSFDADRNGDAYHLQDTYKGKALMVEEYSKYSWYGEEDKENAQGRWQASGAYC